MEGAKALSPRNLPHGEDGTMSNRRSDKLTRNEYQVEAQDSEDHDSRYDCPHSPEEIALLFDNARNDSQEFPSEFENQIAQEALQAISERLSSKYGHESPIDWHDHPEAALLAIGENAARRITQYDGRQLETNERVKDWNQTLTAFAFSLNIEDGNNLWKTVKEHGTYESKPVFAPEE